MENLYWQVFESKCTLRVFWVIKVQLSPKVLQSSIYSSYLIKFYLGIFSFKFVALEFRWQTTCETQWERPLSSSLSQTSEQRHLRQRRFRFAPRQSLSQQEGCKCLRREWYTAGCVWRTLQRRRTWSCNAHRSLCPTDTPFPDRAGGTHGSSALATCCSTYTRTCGSIAARESASFSVSRPNGRSSNRLPSHFSVGSSTWARSVSGDQWERKISWCTVN